MLLVLSVDQEHSVAEQAKLKHPFDQGNGREASVPARSEKAAVAEQEVGHVKGTKPNFFAFDLQFESEIDKQVAVE